jgi:hypothetical protein
MLCCVCSSTVISCALGSATSVASGIPTAFVAGSWPL